MSYGWAIYVCKRKCSTKKDHRQRSERTCSHVGWRLLISALHDLRLDRSRRRDFLHLIESWALGRRHAAAAFGAALQEGAPASENAIRDVFRIAGKAGHLVVTKDLVSAPAEFGWYHQANITTEESDLAALAALLIRRAAAAFVGCVHCQAARVAKTETIILSFATK